MIFFFTATGNSLYAAKQLDSDLVSIPQEMNKTERHYKADRIGIVCPLFEFALPPMVMDFIKTSEFETDYFYILMTYGMHNGGCAQRTAEYLESIGKHVDYYNTIIMVDNALPVFNMTEQIRIDPEKKVDEHLAQIRQDIDERKHMIQPAEQEEIDFYHMYMQHPLDMEVSNEKPLYTVTDACIRCGTCTRVCPRGCIQIKDNAVVYDYTRCLGCYACAHACPVKAIRFAAKKEPNPDARYRNPHVTLAEIIKANNQN